MFCPRSRTNLISCIIMTPPLRCARKFTNCVEMASQPALIPRRRAHNLACFKCCGFQSLYAPTGAVVVAGKVGIRMCLLIIRLKMSKPQVHRITPINPGGLPTRITTDIYSWSDKTAVIIVERQDTGCTSKLTFQL